MVFIFDKPDDVMTVCIPGIIRVVFDGSLIPALKLKALGAREVGTIAKSVLAEFSKYPPEIREASAVTLFLSQCKTLVLLVDDLPFQMGAQLSDVDAVNVVKPSTCRFTSQLMVENDYYKDLVSAVWGQVLSEGEHWPTVQKALDQVSQSSSLAEGMEVIYNGWPSWTSSQVRGPTLELVKTTVCATLKSTTDSISWDQRVRSPLRSRSILFFH